MRIAILGDIHSNLEAFEAVLRALENEGVERYFSIGDIVGYAADPLPCINRVKSLCSFIVAGNHDWGAVGHLDLEYFNEPAGDALLWTAGVLDERDKHYLRSLSLTYEESIGGWDFTLVHSTLDRPEEFKYLVNLQSARKTFSLLKTPLLFIGHTHVPVFIIEEAGEIKCLTANRLKLARSMRVIVNVGSIGQPRDRDVRACYCIFDIDAGLIELKRIEYDIKKAQVKILQAGLPTRFATRLAEGW